MALNPDPYYRDPKIEEALRPQEGSIDAIDRFNAPPPGHSLTSEPQKWAWENLQNTLILKRLWSG